MNFFLKILKIYIALLLAYYVANNLGISILYDKYIINIAILFGLLFFLRFSIDQKFYLLSITVFLPLVFPKLILNNLRWVELMGPLLCFLLIVDVLVKKKSFYSKKAVIYFISLGVILFWCLINFLKNPVSAGFFGGGAEESGIRSYFLFFVGITTFLASYLFVRYRESPKLLPVLLWSSVILGNLILIHFFFPVFQLYFIKKGHTWLGKHETFFRITWLSEMASLGIISLLVMQYKKKWNIFKILLFANLFILLVLSGGRTVFFATCLSICIYVYWANRKILIPLILVFILFAGTFTLIVENIELPGQVERIANVKGGIESQDEYRWKTYQLYFDIFTENPVFGKGIGWTDVSGIESKNTTKFITKQLIHGGHGAYISILAMFGMGGIAFFLTMIFTGIRHSLIVYKNNSRGSPLALFVFLNLIIFAITSYAEGNGFSDMRLWHLTGLAAGLKVKAEGEMNEYK